MLNKEEYEIELLLSVLHKIAGFDLKEYTKNSLIRRVKIFITLKGIENISSLIPLLVYEKIPAQELVDSITIQHSEFFRDPSFFKQLKNEVLPYLRTYQNIKIWVAGCANGEEVYSLCILLKELNLLHKTTVYATDLSMTALEKAKSGIISSQINSTDVARYNESGGIFSLNSYFIKAYGNYKFKDELLKKVVFEQHDLTQDGPFMASQLVLCRNVMIYFNKELQQKVFNLLDASVIENGYLGLGIEETLDFLEDTQSFHLLDKNRSLYQKTFRLISD